MTKEKKMHKYVSVLAAFMIALPVSAISDTLRFDGTYSLSGQTQDCKVENNNMVSAAFRIQNGLLYGLGSVCRLDNPTPIRDMNAVLYDINCADVDGNWPKRIFLMYTQDKGLLRVLDGHAFFNPACEE
ncbi:hypothetical protein [Roseinatronobacter sp.]|uniref:hypothetical protein n=1 Tax=Roseinatronobacter sp. TaxID=1945755 RepID=UPI0025F17783|nr:hypothetical protein [Roseibaca sp.]